MSTNYITRGPMTLDKACEITGWKKTEPKNSSFPVTDGINWVHVEELVINGEKHLSIDRYGLNDPSGFVEPLDCVDEHDEEYDELF